MKQVNCVESISKEGLGERKVRCSGCRVYVAIDIFITDLYDWTVTIRSHSTAGLINTSWSVRANLK